MCVTEDNYSLHIVTACGCRALGTNHVVATHVAQLLFCTFGNTVCVCGLLPDCTTVSCERSMNSYPFFSLLVFLVTCASGPRHFQSVQCG